jgi:hypothetical protein
MMPNNESEKKREEKFFVERFLSKVDLHYIIEPGEAPDFLLHDQSKTTGLEVTRLFHPPGTVGMPRRAIESLREDVVERARSLYQNTENPIVHVSVFFSSSKTFNKPRVSALANELKNLVLRNLPPLPDSHNDEEYDWINRDWFPEEIHRISVWRISTLTISHWSAPDAEYEPSCTPETIQNVIAKKAARFEAYSKVVSECWLLLVLDDFRLSGMFKLPESVLSYQYESPFRRVYLLKAFSGDVFQLNSM